MKIAITYENGQVFQHFGHTAEFKVYEVSEKKIVSSSILSTGDNGHGALATLLSQEGVELLICGGIGAGARTALAEAGIKLYPGVSGNADAQAQAFLDGTLDFDPNTTCNHHGEGHSHQEGHHCAHGKCTH
ncbi:MAG: NifB/NifX family molybdenum-iron cluster-binding protein [Anaerovoracaceae bacterium]